MMQSVVDTVRNGRMRMVTTVLGPGADEAHTDQLYVDVALHGTIDCYRICQPRAMETGLNCLPVSDIGAARRS